jgi:hypothetical protein
LLIKSGVKTTFLWVCEECPEFWRKKDGQDGPIANVTNQLVTLSVRTTEVGKATETKEQTSIDASELSLALLWITKHFVTSSSRTHLNFIYVKSIVSNRRYFKQTPLNFSKL